MADNPRLEALLKRAIDANLRYYEGLGRLLLQYVGDLRSVGQDAGIEVTRGVSAAAARAARPGATQSPQAAAAPALVLEGPKSAVVQGLFMVSNDLPHEVTATVAATPFLDPDGREVHADVITEPAAVSLQPGQRAPIQIRATVTDALQPGVNYRGRIAVPGLSETGVAVILRRSADVPAATTPQATAARKASAGKTARKRASKRKKKAAAGSKRT